ncbi:MAG: hypothetical protein FIB01_06775, partial [Gemmatimonadetes bacterium]|nr:hypothetical protein [Gemmatimonadota bacterium]
MPSAPHVRAGTPPGKACSLLAAALVWLASALPVTAQRPVTEQEALQAALEQLPALAAARADSAAAGAALRNAAEYPN